MSKSSRWLAMNTPQRGSHLPDYMRTKCNIYVQWFVAAIIRDSSSSLAFTCDTMKLSGFDIPALSTTPWMEYLRHMNSAVCGWQEVYLKVMETPQTKGSGMKTLTDGMTRIGSCLERYGWNGKITGNYEVLATNYWDSQMKRADRISAKGGIQRWLHGKATLGLESLVNGANPVLKDFDL